VLECVVNVSEGRRPELVAALAGACGPCLLDVHSDADHHRSVFTLAGEAEALEWSVRALAERSVAVLDLTGHDGAHPRFGVLDVVPWVPFTGWPLRPAPLDDAIAARDRWAAWAGATLQLPCFLYGPERSLPELRRRAWRELRPDAGPDRPHPTAGSSAVGARHELVAYNLWLEEPDLALARRIAAGLRGPDVRALGLAVGDAVQVSCNLVNPTRRGPDTVFDAVAAQAAVSRSELVGLLPARILAAVPPERWAQLDLDPTRTIEARLESAGLVKPRRSRPGAPWPAGGGSGAAPAR
jgi:glutamate formiminotransferase / 5-formyltetrahydrofolate cyclo-ligase